MLLEAMAAGVPIVASDIHGYKNVVQRGVQGLLVEPKNHRALAAALYRLASDAELRHRMGEEGRAKAPEYSWDRVTEQIVDFYREIRERAGAARHGERCRLSASRLAVDPVGADDLEAGRLVDPQRAGRVLGVHAQPGARHPRVAQDAQGSATSARASPCRRQGAARSTPAEPAAPLAPARRCVGRSGS